MSDDLLTKAVLNNAQWCDTMCRSHNIEGEFDSGVWSASVRTPMYYPDAVTLARGLTPTSVLAKIDSSAGCSIKDSYADVNFDGVGFSKLFDASWIGLASADNEIKPAGGLQWSVVATIDELSAWHNAWDSDTPDGLFLPSLLQEPSVTLLAGAIEGRVVAGAVTNAHSGVIGVSNVFGPNNSLIDTWTGVIGAVTRFVGTNPIVGYEQGDDLAAALKCGFGILGPLRIWIA